MLLTTPASGDATELGRGEGGPAARSPWWREATTWAVLLCLLLWAVPFTSRTGGRDVLATTWALAFLVPALALVRPWQVLQRRDLIALAPAAAALLACVVSPTGFDGAGSVAALVLAGLVFLLVRAYLVAGGRTAVVVAALLVAGLAQFAQAWWSWFGGQDSSKLMVGTFFWHNQFAVFMAAVGILAGAVLARGHGPLRAWSAVVVIVTVPSLVLAASRSTLLLFVAAWVALALLSWLTPRRLLGVVAAPFAGLALTALLTSPLLMATSESVAANVEQRQTVVGNGSARVAYDKAALELVSQHPWTGTGFESFASASAPHLRAGLQPTAYVHNGFLQGFVDGGVLLGVALTVAVALPLAVGLRVAWRARLGRRGDRLDGVVLGALLAFGLLAIHSAVDVDWTYPSLLVLSAVLAALVLPTPDGPLERSRSTRWALLGPGVALLLVALPMSVRAAVAEAPAKQLPSWSAVASFGLPVSAPPPWARGAGECLSSLQRGIAAAVPDREALEADLACTRDAARAAPGVQANRARALARLGQAGEAERMAAQLVRDHGDKLPHLLVIQAGLPADSGDAVAGARALREVLTEPRVQANPRALGFAQSWLQSLEG